MKIWMQIALVALLVSACASSEDAPKKLGNAGTPTTPSDIVLAHRQYTASTTAVSLTTSPLSGGENSDAGPNGRLFLTPGLWRLYCADGDARFLQGGSAVTFSAYANADAGLHNKGDPLPMRTFVEIFVSSPSDGYVNAVMDTGTGTLEAMPVK